MLFSRFSRAILKNPDVLSETPVWQLLENDFWGTPLTHSGSHKSYRPLTVFTFRLNYMCHGHEPLGYHLVNVLLHALATALFTALARLLLKDTLPVLFAGLLFASHPIHTEAVAGVVGRADILACIFFLLALLSYVRYCNARELYANLRGVDYYAESCYSTTTVPYSRHRQSTSSSISSECDQQQATPANVLRQKRVFLTLTGVFTVCSLLSKEHGVTVLAVCVAYDVFLHSQLCFKRHHLWRVMRVSPSFMCCWFALSCAVFTYVPSRSCTYVHLCNLRQLIVQTTVTVMNRLDGCAESGSH